MNPQLFRQRHDVLATLQSLDRHSTELNRIPFPSSLFHLQFLPLQSVPYSNVSSEGFSPSYRTHRLHFFSCPTRAAGREDCRNRFPSSERSTPHQFDSPCQRGERSRSKADAQSVSSASNRGGVPVVVPNT